MKPLRDEIADAAFRLLSVNHLGRKLVAAAVVDAFFCVAIVCKHIQDKADAIDATAGQEEES